VTEQKPASAGFRLYGRAVFLMRRYRVQYLKAFTDKNTIMMIFSKKENLTFKGIFVILKQILTTLSLLSGSRL